MPERSYKVVSQLRVERLYAVGETVVMDEAEAAPLLGRVVELIEGDAEPAKPADKSKK